MSASVVQYSQTVFENVTVDSQGNIYKLGRKLKLLPNYNDGYYRFSICVAGKRLTMLAHRLILSSFNPTDDETLVVDHINGIRTDNRLENLRWVTKGLNG